MTMDISTRSLVLGLLALLGADVAAAIALGVLSSLGVEVAMVGLFAMGLVQLLWAVPGATWAYKHGRKSLGHGILIGAALVLLVNGGCFVLVMTSMGSFH